MLYRTIQRYSRLFRCPYGRLSIPVRSVHNKPFIHDERPHVHYTNDHNRNQNGNDNTHTLSEEAISEFRRKRLAKKQEEQLRKENEKRLAEEVIYRHA